LIAGVFPLPHRESPAPILLGFALHSLFTPSSLSSSHSGKDDTSPTEEVAPVRADRCDLKATTKNNYLFASWSD